MEIIRKFTDKKPSLVLIQGSPRRKDSCANQTSKSQKVVEHIISKWGALVDIELLDLSVNEKPTISPCKAVYPRQEVSIVTGLAHVSKKD